MSVGRMPASELRDIREKLLHRWRYPDGDVSDMLTKLLVELDRLRVLEDNRAVEAAPVEPVSEEAPSP